MSTGESVVDLSGDDDGDDLTEADVQTLERDLANLLSSINRSYRVGDGREAARGELVALIALGERQRSISDCLRRFVVGHHESGGVWARASMRSEAEDNVRQALDEVLAAAKASVALVPAIKATLGL